jgi:hypothetical protein
MVQLPRVVESLASEGKVVEHVVNDLRGAGTGKGKRIYPSQQLTHADIPGRSTVDTQPPTKIH